MKITILSDIHANLEALQAITDSWDELWGTRQVVNPGSVGPPKHGRSEACYALWEDGHITLKSQPYDVERTVVKLLALPIDRGIQSQLAEVLRSGSRPR